MTAREMQNAFEQGVNRMDSSLVVESHVVFHWINEAIIRFVKTRYSGNNPKQTSVESTQKRIEDLRTLVKETPLNLYLSFSEVSPYYYEATLPTDYLILLSDHAIIVVEENAHTEEQKVVVTTTKEVDSDTLAKELKNPYSEHKLHYEQATPLRMLKGNVIQLYGDANYVIESYSIRYIKTPIEVDLAGNNCDLPTQTHSEIVDLAVSLFLENTGDPRYSTNKSELSLNE